VAVEEAQEIAPIRIGEFAPGPSFEALSSPDTT
jgi:hypothetical protein